MRLESFSLTTYFALRSKPIDPPGGSVVCRFAGNIDHAMEADRGNTVIQWGVAPLSGLPADQAHLC
jgi:hypothetical protein